MLSERNEKNLVIIGSSPAGYVAAILASHLGTSVAVGFIGSIEQNHNV